MLTVQYSAGINTASGKYGEAITEFVNDTRNKIRLQTGVKISSRSHLAYQW